MSSCLGTSYVRISCNILLTVDQLSGDQLSGDQLIYRAVLTRALKEADIETLKHFNSNLNYPGSGCCTVVQRTPHEERSWVRILPGSVPLSLLFLSLHYIYLSVVRSSSGPSRSCITNDFSFKKLISKKT